MAGAGYLCAAPHGEVAFVLHGDRVEEISPGAIHRLPAQGDAVRQFATRLQRDLRHEVSVLSQLELQRGRHALTAHAVRADQRRAFADASVVLQVGPQRVAGSDVDVAIGNEQAGCQRAVLLELAVLYLQRHHLRLARAHRRAAPPVLADGHFDVVHLGILRVFDVPAGRGRQQRQRLADAQPRRHRLLGRYAGLEAVVQRDVEHVALGGRDVPRLRIGLRTLLAPHHAAGQSAQCAEIGHARHGVGGDIDPDLRFRAGGRCAAGRQGDGQYRGEGECQRGRRMGRLLEWAMGRYAKEGLPSGHAPAGPDRP